MKLELKLSYPAAPPLIGTGETQSELVKIRRARMRRDAIEWAVFWSFIAGLAWIPALHGGDDLAAWGVNAVLFPSLVVLFEISLLAQSQSHPVPIRELWPSAALFAGVVCWILIQNATWTPAAWHHPIWEMAGNALQRPLEGSISVNRDLTTLALMRLITAASAFWLAVQLCIDHKRAALFMLAIVSVSVIYAAYGLLCFAVGSTSGRGSPLSRVLMTSTFNDPEPYAIYAGIGLMAVYSLVVRLYRYEVTTIGGSLRYRIASIIDATGQKGAMLLGAGFLLLVSLLLAGPRDSIIATGFGLLVVAAVSVRWRRINFGGRRRVQILKPILVAMAVLVAAYLTFFGDPIIGTISEGGNSQDNRLAVYLITLRSIFDSPWLGYGYGTFPEVFNMFRDRSINTRGLWSNAHNIYLEVFQGLGVVAGSMLVISILLLVLRCVDGAVERRRNSVCSTAVSAAFLVGVNAFTDFSLQVPAVALTLMTIVGAGIAQSSSFQQAE